jgi:exopolysaccharide biosynthesis WecB/TagA/CpsF family protein
VGFFGGFPELHRRLEHRVQQQYPKLPPLRFWSPNRADLLDPRRSQRHASEIREAGIDLLVVCLGKPRQELWIEHYGTQTGARALLAFGAAADFLAGTANRAPDQLQRMGLEWLHRLGHDPRRLARRYLLEGPPELLTLRRARLVTDFRSAIPAVTRQQTRSQ